MFYCYNIVVCMLMSAYDYSVTRKVYGEHGSFGNR